MKNERKKTWTPEEQLASQAQDTLERCPSLSTDVIEKLCDWRKPKNWILDGKAEQHFVLFLEMS